MQLNKYSLVISLFLISASSKAQIKILFDAIRTALNDTSLDSPVDTAIAILGTPQNAEELKLLLQLQLDKGDSVGAQATMNLLMQDSTTAAFAQTVDSILMVAITLPSDSSSYNNTTGYTTTVVNNTAEVQAKVLHDLMSGEITPLYIEEIQESSSARFTFNTSSTNNNEVLVQVKPVPAKDEVTISLSKSFNSPITIDFAEPATGRVVLSDIVNSNQIQRTCSLVALVPGFYLCILRKQGEVLAILKVIKL